MEKQSIITYLFGILFTISSFSVLHAQDKEFWFAAPDISNEHGPGSDRPTFLMITAGDQDATVQVTIGGVSYLPGGRPIAIAKGTSRKVEFLGSQVDLIENSVTTAGAVQKKGIHIQSDALISAYYQVDGKTSKDIYTLKGEKALGNIFYIPIQDVYITQNNFSDAYDQITIVATENNTKVKITPKDNKVGGVSVGKVMKNSNSSNSASTTMVATDSEFEVTLNANESVLIRSEKSGKTGLKKPSIQGTFIEADKPIAVTVTEDALRPSGITSIDVIGDQLVPTNNLGRHYVVIPGYTEGFSEDYVYILATVGGTKIYLDGSLTPLQEGGVDVVLSASESRKIPIGKGKDSNTKAKYIRTTNPAYCYHISGFVNELGSALIPSMYSISARQVSFYNQDFGNDGQSALFLLFRKGTGDGFKLVNEGAESDFTVDPIPVPGLEADWEYAKVDLKKLKVGTGVYTVTNSKSNFAMGYFNAVTAQGAGTSSYGFLSDFGDFELPQTTYVCNDNSYTLAAPYAEYYKWSSPNGFTSTDPTIVVTQSGDYTLVFKQDGSEETTTTHVKFQNFDNKLTFPEAAYVGEAKNFAIQLNPNNIQDNDFNVEYEWDFGVGASQAPITTTGHSNTVETFSNISWTTPGAKHVQLRVYNTDAGGACNLVIEKYVMVYERPDNIIDGPFICLRPDGTIVPFSIEEAKQEVLTNNEVHSNAPLAVGDIDNDGKVEIIGLKADGKGIVIFTFENGQVIRKKVFDTQEISTKGGIAIARHNGVGYIIVAGMDGYIHMYDPNGNSRPGSGFIYGGQSALVSLADFDNDGTPEIYVGNKIFSIANGDPLFNGATNNKGALPDGGLSSMAFDIDGDGTLELLAGSQIYKMTGTTVGTMALDAGLELATPPTGANKDGATQVADIDGDGKLEVVVVSQVGSNVVLYVWKPELNSSSVLASYSMAGTNYGIPAISDLDGDGKPEIILPVTNGTAKTIYALKYNGGSALTVKWSKVNANASGTEGLTLFDFDQDGVPEVVYKDKEVLHVLNGTNGNELVPATAEVNVKAIATVREFPIIADLDGDGQAEIITTGVSETVNGTTSNLRVFRSSGAQWAPAPSVWNQYNYNYVNVNKDLTIPKTQFAIYMKFNGKDGIYGTADDIRPYNNFRQQQTDLDGNGIPFMRIATSKIANGPGDDIGFIYDENVDKFTISNLKIENTSGEAVLRAPIKITVYKDAVGNAKKYTFNYETSIKVGETKTISFDIDNFKTDGWLPASKIFVRINDAGTGLVYQDVCDDCCMDADDGGGIDIIGNIAWAKNYRNCEGEIIEFDSKALPAGSTIEWQHPASPGVAWNTTKNPTITSAVLNDAGKYIFTAKVPGANGTTTTITHTLPFVSVAPAVMYWRTDATNNDWNNINNWADVSKAPLKAVPSGCTHVYFPAGAAKYPSLKEDNTITDGSVTDYAIYKQPTVGEITFLYGSKLAYQHKLAYDKAYVQYDWTGSASAMARDKFYALAAPLKKMVSGDFGFTAKPLTWQGGFNIANPGGTAGTPINAGDFSRTYATNDVDLSTTNNAIAVKIAAGGANLAGLGNIVEIPYFENAAKAPFYPAHEYDAFKGESKLYYFDTQTLQILHNPVGRVKRGAEAYRFVYEDANGNVPAGNTYKLAVTAATTTNEVMIGNPLMAPINSKKFLDANAGKIAGTTYKVFNGSAWNNLPYDQANNIDPLQAFIVMLNSSTATLDFPLEGTNALTRASYQGFALRQPEGRSLYLKAHNASNVVSDYAVLNADSEEKGNERKMIFPEGDAAEAFFIAPDGKDYNLVQAYEAGLKEIGIGVKGNKANEEITLTFDNVSEFLASSNIRPVLVDKYLGVKQDLSQNNTYAFAQRSTKADNGYIDADRFDLRFMTEDEILIQDGNVSINYIDNQLIIKVKDSSIQKVSVYDLTGRHIHTNNSVNKTEYSSYLPLPKGAYVVKVQTADGKTESGKIAVL